MTGWAVPAVVGLALLAGYGGALLTRPESQRHWSRWRTSAWVAGSLLVVIALAPPLRDHAGLDHRVHMAQHLLLGMYAPLGLVLGAPGTLLLGSLRRRGRRRVASLLRRRPVRVISHPVTAATLAVGGMFLLYLTPLYAASLTRPWLHGLVMVHLLVSGTLFTWSIAGPDPAPHRPGVATRATVLIVAAGAHAFLGKYLYANPHLLDGGHGHAATVEAAARWMYYGGDVAELLLATMLFAWWYRGPGSRPDRSPPARTGGAGSRPSRPATAR